MTLDEAVKDFRSMPSQVTAERLLAVASETYDAGMIDDELLIEYATEALDILMT